MKRLILSTLLASAVALLGMNRAEAGFTVLLTGPATGTGPFTYSYASAINASDSIVSGNFFRIYDFGGYVPGSITAPAGWTASTALVNPTPPPNVVLTHGDDPTITNLIFTYTGAQIDGPQVFTGFTAQSTILATVGNGLIAKDYVGRATQTLSGEFVDSVGNVAVPAIVPEPSSCILLGLGGVSVVGLLARRRASKV